MQGRVTIVNLKELSGKHSSSQYSVVRSDILQLVKIESNTVKTIVVEFPELPIFSVIFTRRLVRGFPTYRTLLEIM